MTKKFFCFEFLKLILFFVLFILLQFASVEGLRPFAFGMLFALVWCDQKIYFIAPLYILSGFLVCFDFQNIINLCFTCLVFILFYLLHKKLKKPLNSLLVCVYAFLSQVSFLYFNSFVLEDFLRAVICVVIGMICLYAYLYLFQSFLIRGLRRKLTIDEIVCLGVLLISIGAGLVSIPDYYGVVSKTVFTILILCFAYVFDSSASLSFSVMLGIGASVSSFSVQTLVLFTVYALALNVAKGGNRIFYLIAILLADIFVSCYFYSDLNLFGILPLCIAGLVFMLIPESCFTKLKNYIITENEEFALRHLINKTRNSINKKILNVSDVFCSMQNTYLSMSKKSLNADDYVSVLAKECKKTICKNCKNHEKCAFFNNQSIKNEIETLSALALSRGKVSVFDANGTLNLNCQKVPVLVENINRLAEEFRKYKIVSNEIESGKTILADQFLGVSNVLSNLASSVNSKISFDLSKEQKLKEELLCHHILCSEAVMYFAENKLDICSLIIKKADIKNQNVEKIVSSVLNENMEIKQIYPSQKPGFVVVDLIPKIFYDVVFGCSGALKNGSTKSGDTHSISRIDDSKILMALCDGMGSGSHAEQISSQAISLIEKFYKAGFNTDLILANVNKILSMRDEENFSALDICVFDLKQSFCELIKVGAPIGFIKKKDQTIITKAGALPLGILDNIKPSSDCFSLSDGDMVVLVSDGVLDGMEDSIKLKDLINNINTKNPQELADQIIQTILDRCKNYAPDDMTVLVGKIWQKV